MEITYTLKQLLIERTLDSARGKRSSSAAGPTECRKCDNKAWAEYNAIEAMLADKLDEEITVNYPE